MPTDATTTPSSTASARLATIEDHCQGCLTRHVTLYADPRGLVRLGDQHPALWCAACYARELGRTPSPAQRVVVPS